MYSGRVLVPCCAAVEVVEWRVGVVVLRVAALMGMVEKDEGKRGEECSRRGRVENERCWC